MDCNSNRCFFRQLISGRPAQEYNRRKKRKGSFWQDRYHATAIQKKNEFQRQEKWTSSIAVGSKEFSEKIKKELGYKAAGRSIIEDDNDWTLREKFNAYSRIQGPKMANIEKKR